jgi:hypothetical protein
MGDRVSISFVKRGRESVTLFSHWGGRSFVDDAVLYVKELRTEMSKIDRSGTYPLSRLDPETVMVDFIRDQTKGLNRVESDLYLGVDSSDGDNSDNGHARIDLETAEPDVAWLERVANDVDAD